MSEPSTILLIRPRQFGYNTQTAANNVFQERPRAAQTDVASKARDEFEHLHDALVREGVRVIVFDDTPEPVKPDAVFPNNWITFHPDGRVILYPMFAPNRRLERRLDIVESLKGNYRVKEVTDLSGFEKENRFLEGTGSIVFDHQNRTAYACASPRTDPVLFAEVCHLLDYEPVYFVALDHGKQPIYHTNVMMCVGSGFAVLCIDAIHGSDEKKLVTDKLESGGNEIVPISISQVTRFAGNMLALNGSGGPLLVMSEAAHRALTGEQLGRLAKFCRLVPVNIGTIETVGGGSARCMMAEMMLPPL